MWTAEEIQIFERSIREERERDGLPPPSEDDLHLFRTWVHEVGDAFLALSLVLQGYLKVRIDEVGLIRFRIADKARQEEVQHEPGVS